MKQASRKRHDARLVDHHERQVQELREDPELARGPLEDAIRELLYGNEQAALVLLRDIISAVGSFPEFAEEIDVHPKALHKMLSERGNPTATNLAALIRVLMKRLDLKPAENLLIAA